jgi:hypothetical protein
LTDFALAILKYIYLIVLWGFALLAIGLIRRDVFINRRLTTANNDTNSPTNAKSMSKAAAVPMQTNVPQNSSSAPLVGASSGGKSLLTQSQSDLHSLETLGSDSASLPTELVVVRGIAAGDVFDLNGFEITIGRDNTSTVALPDNFISTRHARIFFHNGSYYIEDLHSTNGTVVNDVRINSVTELPKGARISIGNNILELR